VRLGPVLGLADDVDPLLAEEDLADAPAEQRVVVDHQHPDGVERRIAGGARTEGPPLRSAHIAHRT
jgi:hypothetical protein